MMEACDHHWVEGLEPDPSKYFGFIYRIDCLETGNSYIGKRQYWAAKRGTKLCKSKIADKGSPRWKEDCWVEADWHYYKGSSKYLAQFMKDNPNYTFTYTILKNCRSRGILLYSEAEYQWEYKVLIDRLPSGKHRFFNHQIGGIRFRPALEVSLETRAKISAANKGKSVSLETKEKIAKTHTGMKLSDNTKKKISKVKKGNTFCVGRVLSIETKDKLRAANLDKNVYTFESVKTGDTYSGTRVQLQTSLKLHAASITRVINGKQKTTGGWSLKEIHESN